MKSHSASPIVSAIGKVAGVVVGRSDRLAEEGGKRVRKAVKLFAGAHDLRRSFCSRWARKAMPATLQRLARHAHVSTTMTFYVNLTADEIGADLWAKHRAEAADNQGNILGNIAPETVENAKG